ncbi:MAG: RNB domain-containing ribonuclease [Elusimicrobia bacterium]|nr:RNB domain-containing ribonuclease [Elusimicrobiota bacterium]
MLDRGFLVQFPEASLREAERAGEPRLDGIARKDLTGWLWSSIDNDDSRDLDQIEFVRKEDGGTRVFVGIADVDGFVPAASSTDGAARTNTTSIYTGVQTFPMLPERYSTHLTSLNEGEKRLAVVAELFVAADGAVKDTSVYPALVLNRARLTYNAVAAWLEGRGDVSGGAAERIRRDPALQEQLRLQDGAAQALRNRRHEAGALTLHTAEFRPTVSPDGQIHMDVREPNRAAQLIEDFMIAANQVTAGFLEGRGFPSLRRVVRTPKQWDRIVELAARQGGDLPKEPDARSLEGFLQKRRRESPETFQDLSLSIIKLLGRGEYCVQGPGEKPLGHFGLAVQGYAHSTAPNRRYPDLFTQRLLKAAFLGRKSPASPEDMATLATHCTAKEDDANKVERLVRKCLAAVMMEPRLGETFDGLVTGAGEKGTWVRLSHPPVEGRVLGDTGKLGVGDAVRVRLQSTNPWKGHIDFTLL